MNDAINDETPARMGTYGISIHEDVAKLEGRLAFALLLLNQEAQAEIYSPNLTNKQKERK